MLLLTKRDILRHAEVSLREIAADPPGNQQGDEARLAQENLKLI